MTKYTWAGSAVPTTLSSSFTSVSPGVGDTFTVADATGHPNPSASEPSILTIDRGLVSEEKILVDQRTGTTYRVLQRGFDGTAATSHTSGQATVHHTIAAAVIDRLTDHVEDGGDPHDTDGLVDAAVTTAKIEDLAVTTAKLADSAVTAAKITDGTIGTDELAAGAVTLAKLADAVADLLFELGDVKWRAADASPASGTWVKADGSAIDRTTYADYFALVGERYGVGDGSTTFNVCNLVDAVPVGVSTLSAGDGEAQKAALSHTHTKSGGVTSSGASTSGAGSAHSHGASSGGASAGHTHSVVGSVGDANNGNPTFYHTHGYPRGADISVAGTTDGPSVSMAHGHDMSFTSGGVSTDHSHSITTNNESSHTHSTPAHTHTDNIAYAAADVTSATELVPWVKVA